MTAYEQKFPQEASELKRRIAGDLPENWSEVAASATATLAAVEKPVASRKSSQAVISALAPHLPELVGGSADLSESNCTIWKAAQPARPGEVAGDYIYYGVREFGMAAAMNGMALHGGMIPFGGTFLVFSDYARNAIRMAALMKQRSIYVLTHDSIGLGEDGPTHQAVEHVSSLRLIPNLEVWRPADGMETAVAWRAGIERADGPSALALSRQNLPPQVHAPDHSELAARGGYVLVEPSQTPTGLIIATGSEVAMAVDAAVELKAQGHSIRVVSMPCVDRFLQQDAEYRESVLPTAIDARLAIEAGVTMLWHQFVGPGGSIMGVDSFGESAPAPAVFKHFGLTVEAAVERMKSLLV